MKKILIIGGGISGLSCAMDMCEANLDITIIEKDGLCGGQSRSEKIDDVSVCYNWRIFTTKYKNLLHLFNNIPNGNGGTIKDNLISTNGNYRSDVMIPLLIFLELKYLYHLNLI